MQFIFKFILFSLIDVPIFILLVFPLLAYSLLCRARLQKNPSGKVNILRLIDGGCIEKIYNKFGTLDEYFLHTVTEFTTVVVGSIFETRNNLLIKLREDYYIMETKIFPGMPLFSVIHFLFRHLYILSKFRISIIHSNSPYLIGLFSYMLSLLSKLPFCVSIHADYSKRESISPGAIPRVFNSLYIANLINKFVISKAEMVLPIRNSLKKELILNGCSETKIRVFPHGISFDQFNKESALDVYSHFKIPKDKLIISSAGRIEKENYCFDILEIAIESCKLMSNVVFIICGDGSELNQLKTLARSYEGKDRILFTGYLSKDLILDIRKISFINLCLMGGFSLIEACACRRPVISYDVEWHHELVISNCTGFLVKEYDKESAVSKIDYLLKNVEYANTLGKNAYELACKNNSLEYINQIKAGIYKELINLHFRKA